MRKLHFSLLLGLSVFATACVDIYKGPESIYNQDLELVLKPSMSGWNKEETLTGSGEDPCVDRRRGSGAGASLACGTHGTFRKKPPHGDYINK